MLATANVTPRTGAFRVSLGPTLRGSTILIAEENLASYGGVSDARLSLPVTSITPGRTVDVTRPNPVSVRV
eukprot:jgi/Pico_ML_1/51895/g25.t1